MLVALQQLAHDDDEHEPGQGPRQRAQQAVVDALVDEAEARREHEPGGQRVGGPEPSPGEALYEDEGESPYPGGHGREQREEKDLNRARYLHTLTLVAPARSFSPTGCGRNEDRFHDDRYLSAPGRSRRRTGLSSHT